MWQRRPRSETREQLFVLATGVFLLVYVATLVRTRAIEWVLLASTGAFTITIVAGLLITELIAPPPADEATDGDAAEAPSGRLVDFTLPAEETAGSEPPAPDEEHAA
ncbi:MAG: hypothetical protein QJR03_07330 [Sphaerobacter sp.]|nr:hypothetical protein [Sphaerobacter sp.]